MNSTTCIRLQPTTFVTLPGKMIVNVLLQFLILLLHHWHLCDELSPLLFQILLSVQSELTQLFSQTGPVLCPRLITKYNKVTFCYNNTVTLCFSVKFKIYVNEVLSQKLHFLKIISCYMNIPCFLITIWLVSHTMLQQHIKGHIKFLAVWNTTCSNRMHTCDYLTLKGYIWDISGILHHSEII